MKAICSTDQCTLHVICFFKKRQTDKGTAMSLLQCVSPFQLRDHVLQSQCYSGMHTKDNLHLLAALFIVSPLHCTNPQEVLAYILYQTARARRIKEENMFVVSLPLFISTFEELSPGSLFLVVFWIDFREVLPMACFKDNLQILNTNKPASFKMLWHSLFAGLVCI